MYLALTLSLLIFSGASPQADLAEACRIAGTLTTARPETFKGRYWWESRWTQWLTQVEASAHDEAFKEALTASGQVAPGARFRLFQELAASTAGKGKGKAWSCPALEKVLASPDADLSALCRASESGELSALDDFHFDSSAAGAAWKVAREKTGAAGFAVLLKASEWPDETLRDCDGLKRILNTLNSQRPRKK